MAGWSMNNRTKNDSIVVSPISFSFVNLLPAEGILDRQQYQQRRPLLLSSGSTRMFSSTPTNLSFSKEQQQPDDEAKDQVSAETGSAGAAASKSDSEEKLNSTSKEEQPAKPTFKGMVRQYGPLFVSTYLVVYVSTVFGFYLGIESGLLDPAYLMSFITSVPDPTDADPDTVEKASNSVEAIVRWLNQHEWTKPAAPYVEKYPWAANFGVAWIATKPTEPIRFGFTVAILPTLARTLGYNAPAANKDTATTTNKGPSEKKGQEETSST